MPKLPATLAATQNAAPGTGLVVAACAVSCAASPSAVNAPSASASVPLNSSGASTDIVPAPSLAKVPLPVIRPNGTVTLAWGISTPPSPLTVRRAARARVPPAPPSH